MRFYETALTVAGGKAALANILNQQPGCTAALCFSDVLALGLGFGLAEAGRQVPGDMSVMGFDNLDWSADATPALTTIDLPARAMGAEIARQIVAHLEEGTALSPCQLPCKIIPRGSVARI